MEIHTLFIVRDRKYSSLLPRFFSDFWRISLTEAAEIRIIKWK